jgi:hypothetical protein
LEGCSSAELLSVRPNWWTSTVKAKVVVGILLGLRFAHILGLVHHHVTTSRIRFDSDHCIQIVDWNPILLDIRQDVTQFGGFSREGWTPERDIQAFASILFELVFGGPSRHSNFSWQDHGIRTISDIQNKLFIEYYFENSETERLHDRMWC